MHPLPNAQVQLRGASRGSCNAMFGALRSPAVQRPGFVSLAAAGRGLSWNWGSPPRSERGNAARVLSLAWSHRVGSEVTEALQLRLRSGSLDSRKRPCCRGWRSVGYALVMPITR